MMWFSILLIVLLLSISSLSLYIGHSHRSSSILTLASKRAITTKTTTTSTTTSAPNHITTKKHTDSSIDTNKKDSPINAEVTIEVNDDFRSGTNITTSTIYLFSYYHRHSGQRLSA